MSEIKLRKLVCDFDKKEIEPAPRIVLEGRVGWVRQRERGAREDWAEPQTLDFCSAEHFSAWAREAELKDLRLDGR